MMAEKSIFHARPSILASVEGNPLVQAVNPKFLDWLLEVEDDYKKLKYYADWVKRLENFDSINFNQRSMALGMSVAEFRELRENAKKWVERRAS